MSAYSAREKAPPAPSSHSRGRNLLFVAGAPRSGTTLLQNMLDSHTHIVGAPEFRHVRHLVETRNRLHADIDAGAISAFCAKPSVDAWFSALIEDLLLPLMRESAGVSLVSEKTPQNVLVFSELLELFPAARLVHVVRDPRAVIASLLQVGRRIREQGRRPKAAAANLVGAIAEVRACLDAGFQAAEEAPGRVFTVRYEDLVAEPEAETQRLCEHLGLDWDPAMLTPSRFDHVAETAVTDASGNVWYTRETFSEDPDPVRTQKWRVQLTRRQQARISAAFADCEALACLRYDLKVGPLARLHQIREAVRKRVRGALRMGIRTQVGGWLRAKMRL